MDMDLSSFHRTEIRKKMKREKKGGETFLSLSLSLRELFPTIKEPFPWFEARKGGGEKTALFRNEGRSLFRGRLVSSLFREGRIWRGDNDEAATSNRPQRQLERRLVKKKKRSNPLFVGGQRREGRKRATHPLSRLSKTSRMDQSGDFSFSSIQQPSPLRCFHRIINRTTRQTFFPVGTIIDSLHPAFKNDWRVE